MLLMLSQWLQGLSPEFGFFRVFVNVGGQDGVRHDAQLRQKLLPARAA